MYTYVAIEAGKVFGVFLVGFVANHLKRFYFSTRPNRRLWSLAESEKALICVAESSRDETEDYVRSSTGVGQVKALTLIMPSISQAYNGSVPESVVFATEQMSSALEGDLIILGGPKNNRVARVYLERMGKIGQPFMMEGNQMFWCGDDSSQSERFLGASNGKEVQKDFGVIMRTVNPFSMDGRSSVVVFIAGSHNFGTTAAARYMVENLVKDKSVVGRKNFCVIVSCDVHDGYTTCIERIKVSCWD